MIINFIKRIRTRIKKKLVENQLRSILNEFEDEDWNKLTSSVILQLYSDGEKQYQTLNQFIDSHEPNQELSEYLSVLDKNPIELILLSNKLTDDQQKLLSLCKCRKLSTKLIPLLETIDEYVDSNYHFDYPDLSAIC